MPEVTGGHMVVSGHAWASSEKNKDAKQTPQQGVALSLTIMSNSNTVSSNQSDKFHANSQHFRDLLHSCTYYLAHGFKLRLSEITGAHAFKAYPLVFVRQVLSFRSGPMAPHRSDGRKPDHKTFLPFQQGVEQSARSIEQCMKE